MDTLRYAKNSPYQFQDIGACFYDWRCYIHWIRNCGDYGANIRLYRFEGFRLSNDIRLPLPDF